MTTITETQDLAQMAQEKLVDQTVQFADVVTTVGPIGVFSIQVTAFGVWLLAPEFTQLLAFVLIIIPLLMGSGLYKVFRRRGNYVAGYIAYLSLSILAVFFIPFVLPGIMPAIALAYLVANLTGNFLLNLKGAIIVGLVTTIALIVNILFAQPVFDAVFIPIDNVTLDRFINVFVSVSVLVLASATIGIVVYLQQKQYLMASQMQLELAARANADNEQRAKLEHANSEIEMRIIAEQEGREQLQNLIDQIRDLITSLNTATTEIQAAAVQQIASTTEQSAAVNQTAATVDEVLSSVKQTSDNAYQVAQVAKQTLNVSRQGQDAVRDSIQGIGRVQRKVKDIINNANTLAAHTQQIEEIISTVEAIADQSKLLAINATIEAARAGKDGKGFSVVAMEVRQLADQSNDATARISAILNDIQQATATTVQSAGEGSEETERTVYLVAQAGDAIQELAATLETAADAASQIAASTQQQTNGMEQLASAMNHINQSTQQTAASATQTEQSIRQLADTAQQLTNTTTRYNGSG